MKAYYFCLAVLLIVGSKAVLSPDKLGPIFSKLLKPAHDKCLYETGANPQDIQKSAYGIFSEDIKYKKYILCVQKFFGALDPKTGKVLLARVAEVAPPQLKYEIVTIITDCLKKTPANLTEPYDRAHFLLKCYYNMDPANYILV